MRLENYSKIVYIPQGDQMATSEFLETFKHERVRIGLPPGKDKK